MLCQIFLTFIVLIFPSQCQAVCRCFPESKVLNCQNYFTKRLLETCKYAIEVKFLRLSIDFCTVLGNATLFNFFPNLQSVYLPPNACSCVCIPRETPHSIRIIGCLPSYCSSESKVSAGDDVRKTNNFKRLELELDPAKLPTKKVGDGFAVMCKIIGMGELDWDKISIQWVQRRNGVDNNITSTGRVRAWTGRNMGGSQLMNEYVQNQDAGEYVCMVLFNQEWTEASITLHVCKQPPIPQVLFVKERQPNLANISIQGFQDLPEAVRPLQVSFYVIKQEDVIANSGSNHLYSNTPSISFTYKSENYYVIPNLTQKTVYQVWALAENEEGRSPTSPEPLIYETTESKEPPKLFNWTDIPVWSYRGHRAELYCQVHANPPPIWTWNHDNKTLVSDGEKIIIEQSEDDLKSTLKIVTDTQDDFGNYTCNADNGIGNEVAVKISIVEIQLTPTPEMLVDNMKCFRFCFP